MSRQLRSGGTDVVESWSKRGWVCSERVEGSRARHQQHRVGHHARGAVVVGGSDSIFSASKGVGTGAWPLMVRQGSIDPMVTINDRHAVREAAGMVVVPSARYTSQEFFDLEMELLWPHVWRVACGEEEVPASGDFLEYTIGDQSILIVRTDAADIRAFFNTCPHRGTRL